MPLMLQQLVEDLMGFLPQVFFCSIPSITGHMAGKIWRGAESSS